MTALCRPSYEHELMAGFGTLQDEFYPGSKQKRRESQEMKHDRLVEERRQAREDEGWDAHPIKDKIHPVTKQPMELFTVGALAKALQRNSVTMRTWIRKGWLPRAMFQTKPVYGSRGDAGRRLWTRAQIEGIVAIAREEGLLGEKPPRIQTTNFTHRVTAAWKNWL
jgi:hypothetical protein